MEATPPRPTSNELEVATLGFDDHRSSALRSCSPSSPEQVESKDIDARSDIFSLGVVFYEMLTGRRPFQGETPASVLSAILKDDPEPVTARAASLPRDVARIVRRCLAKEPARRFQSALDVFNELRELEQEIDSGEVDASVGHPRDGRVAYVRVGAASALVAAIVVGAASWFLSPLEPGTTVRFSVPPPDGVNLAVGRVTPDFTISPDGRTVAFVGEGFAGNIYLRSVDAFEARSLMVAEGRELSSPFFSPDGEWLGVLVRGEALLKKVPLSGGFPTTIGSARNTGFKEGSWGEDGTIVFSSYDGVLYRISADGGEPERLPISNRAPFRDSPQHLPGGKHLLFNEAGPGDRAWRFVVLDLETGEGKTLLERRGRARFVSTGHLVFGTDGVLWAAPFDLDRLELRGEPISVLQNVRSDDFALSSGGTLAYLASGAERERIFVWVDREGQEVSLPVEPDSYARPRISPDGGRIAFELNGDIWVRDVERQTSSRLTFDPAFDSNPLWAPDGTHVFFASRRAGRPGLFSKASDGSGKAEPIEFRRSDEVLQLLPEAFTADGLILLTVGAGGTDLGKLTLLEEPVYELLLNESFEERWPALSPDGRFMAYAAADEAGRFHIYVRPFPDVNGGLYEVTSRGGNWPFWAPDGSELFYFSIAENAFFAVPIQIEPTFRVGAPHKLFGGDYVRGGGNQWDITPDGERFLLIREIREVASTGIHVVLNWTEELKRLVPNE